MTQPQVQGVPEGGEALKPSWAFIRRCVEAGYGLAQRIDSEVASNHGVTMSYEHISARLDGLAAQLEKQSVSQPQPKASPLCECGHAKHEGPCLAQTSLTSSGGVRARASQCPCLSYRPSVSGETAPSTAPSVVDGAIGSVEHADVAAGFSTVLGVAAERTAANLPGGDVAQARENDVTLGVSDFSAKVGHGSIPRELMSVATEGMRNFSGNRSGETAAPAINQVTICTCSYVGGTSREHCPMHGTKPEYTISVSGSAPPAGFNAEVHVAAAPATPTTGRSDQRIARMSGPELIANAEEVLALAGDKLSALCHGEKWRMSIPVSDHDSDIAFGRVIALAKELLKSSVASPSVEEDSEPATKAYADESSPDVLSYQMGSYEIVSTIGGKALLVGDDDCNPVASFVSFDEAKRFGRQMVRLLTSSTPPAGEGAPTDAEGLSAYEAEKLMEACGVANFGPASKLWNEITRLASSLRSVRDERREAFAALDQIAADVEISSVYKDDGYTAQQLATYVGETLDGADAEIVRSRAERDAALSRVAELERERYSLVTRANTAEAELEEAFLKLREEVEALPDECPTLARKPFEDGEQWVATMTVIPGSKAFIRKSAVLSLLDRATTTTNQEK
jgi:hypothetical protein